MPPSSYPYDAAIECPAVAIAFVPGRSLTTFAVIASHTFTTRRISGASCSCLRVVALSAVLVLMRPTVGGATPRVPRCAEHDAG
jgi:hypothetical protein